MRLTHLASFFCCALLCGCPRASEPAAAPPPLQVHCVPAITEAMQKQVVVARRGGGRARRPRARRAADRGPAALARVQEGQRVERGAVLAEVDARQANDAAVQAQATLAAAEAGVQNARVSAERVGRLLEHGIAARQEVDDANARLLALKATADGARAALEVARRNVAFATVRSPLSGVVLRTLRAAGDLVDGTPATPVVEVGDPTALNLLASAAPAELVQLALGQRGTAHFQALPGKSYEVEVKTISPASTRSPAWARCASPSPVKTRSSPSGCPAKRGWRWASTRRRS